MPVSIRQLLTAMPVVDQQDWSGFGLVKRWLAASRAAVFSLTWFSVLVAGLLAAERSVFDPSGWLLCLFGLTFAHGTNNLINDYVDFRTGLDRDNYVRVRYGTHVLNDGLLTERHLLIYIVVTGLIGLIFGAAAIMYGSINVIWPFLAGALLLIAYTWPLKHWALGEIAVLLTWGPLMVAGTFQVMTGFWDWNIALIGLWLGIPQTLIIFGKHIDKLAFDRGRQVRTLPVLLGHRRSRRLVVCLAVAVYVGLVLLVALGMLPWLALIALGSLPASLKLFEVYRNEAPLECPANYPVSLWPLWFTVHSFQWFRIFAGLLLLGLLTDLLFS